MAEKKQGLPLYPNLPPTTPNPYPGHYPQAQVYYPHDPLAQGPPPPYSYGYPEPSQIPTGPPPSYYPNVAPQPQQPMIHQGAQNNMVYVQGGYFDAGARFGRNGGQVRVPPPPPGYSPTPAQLAAMNGQAVQMDQKKASFFSGGKGAGSTLW